MARGISHSAGNSTLNAIYVNAGAGRKADGGNSQLETIDDHHEGSEDSKEFENTNCEEEENIDAFSEAGDELNCTQIADDHQNDILSDDDDDEMEEDAPLASLIRGSQHSVSMKWPASESLPEANLHSQPMAASTEPTPARISNPYPRGRQASLEKSSTTSPMNVDIASHVVPENVQVEIPREASNTRQLTTCMICGADLMKTIQSGWKGRLDHVKRCSKKHGIQAKDIFLHQDDDDEGVSHQDKPVGTTTLGNNPLYPETSKTAHRKALPFYVDKQSVPTGEPRGGSSSTKAPTAFSVLMAGARRAAQEAKYAPPTKKKKSPNHESAKTTRNGNKQNWKGKRRSWEERNRNSSRSCPAFKKIPGTDFVVDGFHYASESLTQNYFLTHFHADHYGGLTKHWNLGTIYCSGTTARLVNQQLGVDMQFLHCLPMNTPVPICWGSDGTKVVNVTLYDANHCPGAVMFHFHVDQRHIMHVGDFRWNRQKMAPILQSLNIDAMDDLYLDTTYCDPKYVLPTQVKAIQATVATAVAETRKYQKQRLLLCFGAYTIGLVLRVLLRCKHVMSTHTCIIHRIARKERIYLAVADRLKQKVYVDSRRFRVLQAALPELDLKTFITTNAEETNIWVVPLGHVNMKQLPAYHKVKLGAGRGRRQRERIFDKIVGFRPTGWSLAKGRGTILTTATRSNITIHSVPYSEHSSFPELVEAIHTWKPRRIIPTVSVGKSKQQVDLLLRHLDNEQR